MHVVSVSFSFQIKPNFLSPGTRSTPFMETLIWQIIKQIYPLAVVPRQVFSEPCIKLFFRETFFNYFSYNCYFAIRLCLDIFSWQSPILRIFQKLKSILCIFLLTKERKPGNLKQFIWNVNITCCFQSR